MVRADDKPVASVRPIQSTPIPMMPRQVAMGMAGSSAAGGLPVNSLQKAGVQVQRIVTTTGNENSQRREAVASACVVFNDWKLLI